MNITPAEVHSIEDMGMLDGNPVKLLRTKGGFYMAIAKPKGKLSEEAIGAGSHPAIVKFNLGKQYPDFQPSMMKSQHYADNTVVEKHSHFLSEDLRKSGHELYSIQSGNKVDFHLTKHNVNVTSVKAGIVENALVVNKLNIPKDLVRVMASAVSEKALSCSKTVKVK
jgi:hypothetical protein